MTPITAGFWRSARPANGRSTASTQILACTIAAEIEPIENWLELEIGLSTLPTAGNSELSGDVLFKKPCRCSDRGVYGQCRSVAVDDLTAGTGNSMSAEFALDFMFWPTKDWLVP